MFEAYVELAKAYLAADLYRSRSVARVILCNASYLKHSPGNGVTRRFVKYG